jgi:hypothetical protein
MCPGCGGRVWSTLLAHVLVVEPQNHPAPYFAGFVGFGPQNPVVQFWQES